MTYELKNCRTGEPAELKTTVDIKKEGDIITFAFHSEGTKYFCPFEGYNGFHSRGDACEILIGTDPTRKTYYEMEISAKGDLMLAKMKNLGVSETGPNVEINLIDVPFIKGNFVKTELGYDAEISFDINCLELSEGDIFFNAYRAETDGGTPDKYLFALNPTYLPNFHVPDKYLWLKDFV